MSDWNDDDYAYDEREPKSRSGEPIQADEEIMDWVEYKGLTGERRYNEGAIFLALGNNDAHIIAVHGAQVIHHDRHIDDLNVEGSNQHSNKTWNLVVSGDGEQMLLSEVAQDQFIHFPLKRGKMIYLETVNRHLVSRESPDDVCVMLQVQGFGPDQQDEAYERMIEVYNQERPQKATV